MGVDHLYVDMNSLLHNSLRNSRTVERFHEKLHMKLDGIMKAACPRKSVMLAVDGPAPIAKLMTQRERRKVGAKSEKGGWV